MQNIAESESESESVTGQSNEDNSNDIYTTDKEKDYSETESNDARYYEKANEQWRLRYEEAQSEIHSLKKKIQDLEQAICKLF